MEIANAKARGDFYVDDKDLGFVLRTKKWLDHVTSISRTPPHAR